MVRTRACPTALTSSPGSLGQKYQRWVHIVEKGPYVDPRSDPILLSILDDLLTDMTHSLNVEVYQAVVSQSLPTLCNALAQAKPDESWIASSAIDLTSSLARGASYGRLGENFFATLAPTLFECMGTTQDQETLEVLVSY